MVIVDEIICFDLGLFEPIFLAQIKLNLCNQYFKYNEDFTYQIILCLELLGEPSKQKMSQKVENVHNFLAPPLIWIFLNLGKIGNLMT